MTFESVDSRSNSLQSIFEFCQSKFAFEVLGIVTHKAWGKRAKNPDIFTWIRNHLTNIVTKFPSPPLPVLLRAHLSFRKTNDLFSSRALLSCPFPYEDGISIVSELCPTLYDPMDCSPPGFCVHGILQARILEWFTIPFSRGSS